MHHGQLTHKRFQWRLKLFAANKRMMVKHSTHMDQQYYIF